MSSLSPRSPPPLGLLDFYGRRKQMVKIQVLEREIGLLQEELKSLEGLHPASRCCRELDTFVGCSSDPFTPINHKISKSHRFWKQIRLNLLLLLSRPWVCFTSCCMLPKGIVKGCCICCSSSNSKCCASSKTKKTVSGCCKVVKLLATPCSYCLLCFSCNCCVHNCCHACCHQ